MVYNGFFVTGKSIRFVLGHLPTWNLLHLPGTHPSGQEGFRLGSGMRRAHTTVVGDFEASCFHPRHVDTKNRVDWVPSDALRVLCPPSAHFPRIPEVITGLKLPNRFCLPLTPSLYYFAETMETVMAKPNVNPARRTEWEQLVLREVAYFAVYSAAEVIIRTGVSVVLRGETLALFAKMPMSPVHVERNTFAGGAWKADFLTLEEAMTFLTIAGNLPRSQLVEWTYYAVENYIKQYAVVDVLAGEA